MDGSYMALAAAQALHRFCQRAVNGVVVEPP